jgi:rhomboid protease GluP
LTPGIDGSAGQESEAPLAPPDEPRLITSSMLAVERVDFERGMRYMSPLTLGLMGTLAVVFIWQLGTGSLESLPALLDSGALQRDRVLGGEWWRLVTATFLHGGLDHLIGNLVSLYVLGLACEHAFGAAGMLGVYTVSGIAGSLMSMALNPGPSVGASGAIFGLMGAIVVVLYRQRDEIALRDNRIGIVIAVWAGFTLLLGSIDPVVDNGGHLGGLIAGSVAGRVMPTRLLGAERLPH